MDPALPFVLAHDAKTGGALLFTGAARSVEARLPAEVEPALAILRAAVGAGQWVAGGLTYESGLALEPRLAPLAASGKPLLWFGIFGPPERLSATALNELLDRFERPTGIASPSPRIAEADHSQAVAHIQALIAAGDIYQANLTFQADVPVCGHPLALFRRLFRTSQAPHAALVHNGQSWWLSLSPELFFTLDHGQLTARPMKGTAPRDADPSVDRANAEALAADPKNRAENLMITDLIRNDLARVAIPGSVRVPSLFTAETYPSIHQLTSTVTAELACGLGPLDALQALFPCGSITGAPKIRAMQVIAEVEAAARGTYCGSIGWAGPTAAHFNVAIRTLVIEAGKASLGLGSGIVADSVAADEWQECLAKARFLEPSAPTSLIETIRRKAGGQLPRLDLHLARLSASAARFGFPLALAEIGESLAALPQARKDQRLRLLLSSTGRLSLHLSSAPETPAVPVPVALAPLPVPATDWRLHHKSSNRGFYDEARRACGAFEVLFTDRQGFATEGSFTSIFVSDGAALITPPLERGLIPGVLRAALLQSGEAREGDLSAASLASASSAGRLFIGNSLRGLLPATLVSPAARL